jgi:nucleoside-diphosphate-sugar epimerase
MNNILLTGSTGFLGNVLKMYLLKNHEIFDLNTKFGTFIHSLEKEVPIFNNYSFDCVIHAAGIAHILPRNKKEKSKIYNTNFFGTKNLLKGLEQSSIPKYFVFISSVSVYGLLEGSNITENYPLNAIDPYGLSKIHSEELIINWCNNHNVKCTILRLPIIVGINPPGNLGAMIKAINKGYYFNIDRGINQKSMVLAVDIAKYIIKAAYVGGIYNLTDGIHPSFSLLSSVISDQLGKSKPKNIPFFFAKILARFGDLFGNIFPINSLKLHKITSTLTFDDTKARNAFGWNPGFVLHYINNTTII